MKNLYVYTQKENVFTSSEILAKELEITHKDLMVKIKKTIAQKEKLEKGGVHPPVFPQVFKEVILTNKMGREYNGYAMNRSAFIKLVMQLSKYDKAWEVQDKVIEAFFCMETALKNNEEASWLQTREGGIETRKDLMSTVQKYIKYCEDNGSKNANRYNSLITNMTYKCLELINGNRTTPIRDQLNSHELWTLKVAEAKADEMFQYCIDNNIEYHEGFQLAKQSVLELFKSLPNSLKKPTQSIN